jgi:hypothetical protein
MAAQWATEQEPAAPYPAESYDVPLPFERRETHAATV